MSSADSANSDPTSLEKQLTTKCSMLGYFDQNISEAIKKLEEIKGTQKDGVAKKSPIFSLVSSAEEDLQAEAHNLYSQGLKYVFSVEEEPRFPWEALLVFSLGVLQIVGGVFLTAFTFGTFAHVGMELIIEGIKDCISSIESMVKGEFSWKSWAINKAISLGVSLISFGVGKLIAKGFKACKMSVKGFGKQLKSMPKFLSKQAKDGLSVVAKTNMKNAVKLTAKKMGEEIITYGLGKMEEKMLTGILNIIKNYVKSGIKDDVKSNLEKEPLATSVYSVILSHIEDKKQLHDLLQDKRRKSELLAIFRELSNTAVQPFYADLSWQNRLNSSFNTVINRAKAEATGKAFAILTAIQVVHTGALAADAIIAVRSLSTNFFFHLQEQLNKLKEEKGFSEGVEADELSASDAEMLKEFRQDLADIISSVLADASVEVFHQKISSHIVSHVQSKVNGVICSYVTARLKTDRTEEKLRAGQNNRYISYMPAALNPHLNSAGKAGQHAEKIMNPMTAGSILDIRVLSEATGTKVIILSPDKDGKLTKMQELSPGIGPASQTVTLIYRPKSDRYPDGHYDVRINNRTVSIVSEGNGCLFHALARGMNPKASEGEINSEARRLRSVEAETLLRQPGQWDHIAKRKNLTEGIRGGDWFMAEGAKEKMKETKEFLKDKTGEVKLYKEVQKERNKNSELNGHILNADHQPPVKSILKAQKLNQNSPLAKAMLEVATNSSPLDDRLIPDVKKDHGLWLPVVYVPTEIHHEFPSTKSKAFRDHLAETISNNDVEGTFKLMILGGMVRSDLESTKNFKTFQNNPNSKTRFAIYEESFPQHSKKMVDTWFNLLQDKRVMTETHRNNINKWIDNKGYKDQNDPHRNKVSKLL